MRFDLVARALVYLTLGISLAGCPEKEGNTSATPEKAGEAERAEPEDEDAKAAGAPKSGDKEDEKAEKAEEGKEEGGW
jgi:hypothetical protein